MRQLPDRLADILQAIDIIEKEVTKGRDSFDADEKNQVWIVHHLRIIGEAVRACSTELKSIAPETPWAQIVGMRHILIRDYFGVDLDEVWTAAERDIPELKKAVKRLMTRTERNL